MSSKIRWRNAGEREIIEWALSRGWQILKRTSNNHLLLRYLETDATTTIPSKLVGYDNGYRLRIRGQIKRLEKNARQTKPIPEAENRAS